MKININSLRLIFLLSVIILMAQNISANCDNDQIDINEANLNELDKLVGVGPAIAQNIINARPYKELDDLIDAEGIGEAKLKGIKSQGLACVEREKEKGSSNLDQPKEENSDEIEDELINISVEEETNKITPPKMFSPIKLETKTIKSEKNNDSSSNRYAIYGLIGFGILLSLLLFFRGKKYKTEFK